MKDRNLLFIFSDEHQARALSSAGHPFVQTPNLDKLAERGTRFENCYTPCPICVPARASLMTGQHVHKIGNWDNAAPYTGEDRSFAHELSDAGVHVDSIGKLHFKNADVSTGFNKQHIPMHVMDGIGAVWAAVRDPLPETPRQTKMLTQIGEGLSDYNRYDLAVTEETLKWLREDGRSVTPWMLHLGFVAPHFPLVVPEEFLKLYDPADMPLPPLHPTSGYVNHPWMARMIEYADTDSELRTADEKRLAIAAYFGLCTFLDHQIGRVLDVLEEQNMADNTTIIYASDHGETLGMRGRWGKSVLYRESAEVPMIMAGAGIPQGHVHKAATNLLDLPPTFLEFFDVPVPERFDGVSLYQQLQAPPDPDRTVFSQYHAVGAASGGFMIASENWKYHYYIGYAPELFDLSQDPDEMNDLAGDPDYKEVQERMHAALLVHCDPQEVDARAKSDQNKLVESHGGPEKVGDLGPPSATPPPV
ncbi:MAG: sulfatase-like hydrolase/transferase [Methyloligellaceae bacterium]